MSTMRLFHCVFQSTTAQYEHTRDAMFTPSHLIVRVHVIAIMYAHEIMLIHNRLGLNARSTRCAWAMAELGVLDQCELITMP